MRIEKWEMKNEKWGQSYELTKKRFFYWVVKLIYKNELLLV